MATSPPCIPCRYLEQYGCSRWTDEALDIINSFGPIIEIGAGGESSGKTCGSVDDPDVPHGPPLMTAGLLILPGLRISAGHGHWQKALAERGGDVLAFDDESSLPMQGMPNLGKVVRGNEKELKK